jgi:hypothetical protein
VHGVEPELVEMVFKQVGGAGKVQRRARRESLAPIVAPEGGCDNLVASDELAE